VQRVVEVHDSASGGWGSGYLLSARVVLTAAHCVRSGEGARVEVRPVETDGSFESATVAWWRYDPDRSDGEDFSLIVLDASDSFGAGDAVVSFGEVVGRCEWRAVGFPRAQVRRRAGNRAETEAASGCVDPGTGQRFGVLDLQIESGAPKETVDGKPSWAGMSGAAVLAGNRVVAVISQQPGEFRGDRLRSLPIRRLLADPDARRVIFGDADAVADIEPVRLERHRLDLARDEIAHRVADFQLFG